MEDRKTTVLNLTDEEFVYPGNRACAGCGLNILYRIGLKAIGRDAIQDGHMKLSEPSAKLLRKKELPPVSEYLEAQGRFGALGKDAVETLQQEVDAKWAAYRSQMM